MTENILTVNGLTFSFKSRAIFSDLSFAISKGNVLYVKGANGAGKTTLLKVLAGILKPHSGIIRKKIDEKTIYLASEVNHLFLKISAYKNIEFWLGDKTESLAIFHLNNWGISGDYVAKALPIGKFSTGMKRRVALARTFASNAKILLLDEPCNGLDEEGIAIFKRNLKSVLSQGKVAILTSHDSDILDGLDYLQLELGKP